MPLYDYLKYRPALEEAVENRKKLPGKFTLRQLAEASGLQPSFLTNVMKGRFDFNADQLYAVASELGFNTSERHFLGLLLEHERSTFKPRRDEIRKEIDRIRQENQKTEKYLTANTVELTMDALAEYYMDPFVPLVHVHLNLAPYNRAPDKLGPALGISESHLRKILETLVRVGYIKREGSSFTVVGKNKHLPRENPLSVPNLALMRMKSIDQMHRLSPEKSYFFSTTFTGTDETREEIHLAFMAFLKKVQAIVKPAPSQKAFQLNFDLFPWAI